jgi:hypothetical protein
MAHDQVARVKAELKDLGKFDYALADPFNDREDSSRTLVLLRDISQTKNQSGTEEDLNVMSHILDKAAASRDERNARAVGITFHPLFGSSPALRNLYVEGYGAIFFLNVNYSLTPPPPKVDDSETKPERDSEWEKARRELSNPPGRHAAGLVGETESRPAPEYDADKVESLQKNLAQALKNAAHIRALKPDETVTIVVTGRAASQAMKLATVKSNSKAASAGSARDKLILRAKRSDIEAFQNEKLAPDDFRKKLAIFLGETQPTN